MLYIKMQSYHTGRRVQENQEDGVAEVDIKKPHVHGFFVYRMLGMALKKI
jgi:hypothetical protein